MTEEPIPLTEEDHEEDLKEELQDRIHTLLMYSEVYRNLNAGGTRYIEKYTLRQLAELISTIINHIYTNAKD